MSSIWGKCIKISVFGESHGTAIGVVIDGLPPGIQLDKEEIQKEMDRRKPGLDTYSTPRKEGDMVDIVSGFFNGHTTGTPLCGIIRNIDKRSKDYDELKDIMRPGHADFAGRLRYNGYNDYRGGGHFSGRLTAPIVFAGAIATQYLRQQGITIGTHLLQVGRIEDTRVDLVNIQKEQLTNFRNMRFPVIDPKAAENMKMEIDNARMDQNSVGGMLETAIINLPAGLGSPMFESVESRLSAFVFSIPGVKGIDFGTGFGFASMCGSEGNDGFKALPLEGAPPNPMPNSTKTKDLESCPLLHTNHSGGINGGITNGMPVVFRTVFRPTPSIGRPQQALDMKTMKAKKYCIHGRHDPCIALRAVPVLDAAAALVVLDLVMEAKGHSRE